MPTKIPLDMIEVPRPCPADWDAMHGDSRVRFCDHCQLNVYNLSAMTREAAEQLMAEKEGHLCARFYRRADGTIITADCGGGWKLRAKKLGRLALAGCAAVFGGMLAPFGWTGTLAQAGEAIRGEVQVKGEIAAKVTQGDVVTPTTRPTTQPTTQPLVTPPTMGLICPPAQPTPKQ